MPPTPYAAGDRVKLTDGPLAGFEAEVRETPQGRLRLAVDVRGMTVPIEAHDWQVVRAPGKPSV